MFCLSIIEAEKCFGTQSMGLIYKNQGPFDGNDGWWLCSPGQEQDEAARVSFDYIYELGLEVDCPVVEVRPAMWLNIE